ncbi:MAG: dipeptidase [Candidatus Aminicenantes bacterium]|nr:dipeptidase [Candidatus Aminicenantes bacterium]
MNRFFVVSLLGFLFVCAACVDRHNDDHAQDSDIVSRAKAIHDRVLTLDAHIDIEVTFFTPDSPEKMGHKKLASLSSMKSGGLDGAFFAAYVEQGPLTEKGYDEAHKLALEKIDTIHRVAREELPGEIGIARHPDEVLDIHGQGKITAIIAMENGYPLGETIGNLSEFFDLGVRYITLSHIGHNQICTSNLGLDSQPPLHSGLSPFGQEVVTEMNRLGMIIDVSHIGKQSVLDVVRLSRAPVMASHSSHRDFCGIERMWDDEQLLALKENGGVFHLVGLKMTIKEEAPEKTAAIEALRKELGFPGEYWPFFLAFEKASSDERAAYNARLEEIERKFPSADVRDFVDHIDSLVERIGIDHVAISSDFYDRSWSLVGWEDAGETFNITLELVRRGYGEDQIAKIWSGNTLRVWREVEQVAHRFQTD